MAERSDGVMAAVLGLIAAGATVGWWARLSVVSLVLIAVGDSADLWVWTWVQMTAET